jgi:hypothetical protein
MQPNPTEAASPFEPRRTRISLGLPVAIALLLAGFLAF